MTTISTLTERITLAKALAVKNRMAGRLVQTQSSIETSNSVLIGQRDSSVDVRGEFARYEAIQAGIVAVKGAIQRANLPIFERIFELAEIKTRIKLLVDLPTKHGAEPGSYGGAEYVYDATFLKPEVLELVRKLEAQADQFQDELNQYNAATTVEISTAILDLAR